MFGWFSTIRLLSLEFANCSSVQFVCREQAFRVTGAQLSAATVVFEGRREMPEGANVPDSRHSISRYTLGPREGVSVPHLHGRAIYKSDEHAADSRAPIRTKLKRTRPRGRFQGGDSLPHCPFPLKRKW